MKENSPVGRGANDSLPDLVGGDASVGAKGTPFSAVCSNLPARPASPSLFGIEDLPPAVPSASKKKNKSPVKKYSAKSRASSDSRQSTAGLCRWLDADLGTASGLSSAAASPFRDRPILVRSPASMTRKSGRVSNCGERVADRAARRAAARDLPPSGSRPVPSSSCPVVHSPVHLVLPSQFDEHLLSILDDVGICLDASLGSPTALLGVIRANELAQADIAKAKEVGVGPSAPLVVAGGDEAGDDRSQASLAVTKHGVGKRAKSYKALSRSSLRIKNLSFR